MGGEKESCSEGNFPLTLLLEPNLPLTLVLEPGSFWNSILKKAKFIKVVTLLDYVSF